MKPQVEGKKNDYETPDNVWRDILEFIPKDKVIWCPFYCNGLAGNYLKKNGISVIHNEEDFFENNHGDICIDNPTYFSSQKKVVKREIMKRLQELDKPFMLLVPAQTLQTKYYKKLFDKHTQLIIPSFQYSFIQNGVKARITSYTLWICWKMNFEKDINII